MTKILKLPVNKLWYLYISAGVLRWDYRHQTDYWRSRLENRKYDFVEFYSRFDKSVKPLRFKLKEIRKGMLGDNPEEMYIIEFENITD